MNSEDQNIKVQDLFDMFCPEKSPLETTSGTFYMRSLTASDFQLVLRNSPEDNDIGKSLLKSLCSRNPDREDRSEMSEDDFSSLNASDVSNLVQEITSRCFPDSTLENPCLTDLGRICKLELSNRASSSAMDECRKAQIPIYDQSPLSDIRRWEPTDIYLPKPEETPLGQATLQNAQSTEALVQQMNLLLQSIQAQAQGTEEQAKSASQWSRRSVWITGIFGAVTTVLGIGSVLIAWYALQHQLTQTTPAPHLQPTAIQPAAAPEASPVVKPTDSAKPN